MTTNNWKNYKECLIDLEERCISLDDAIEFIETQIAQAEKRGEEKGDDKVVKLLALSVEKESKVYELGKLEGYKQGFEDCKVAYENGIKSALSISSL